MSTSPAKKDGTTTKSDVDLTEKEANYLKIAVMHCLKSGPPEIDYQKFVKHGEFNTLKTAQNTWGKIKAKLTKAAAANAAGDDEGVEGGDEDGEKGEFASIRLSSFTLRLV